MLGGDGLAALAQRYASDVALIDAGADQLKVLEKAATAADKAYDAAAQKLSAARNKAAEKQKACFWSLSGESSTTTPVKARRGSPPLLPNSSSAVS